MWFFEQRREQIRKRILAIDVGCIDWEQPYPGPNDVVVHIRSYSAGGGCKTIPSTPRKSLQKSFSDLPYDYYAGILRHMASVRPWHTVWLSSRCGAADLTASRLIDEFGARALPAGAEWRIGSGPMIRTGLGAGHLAPPAEKFARARDFLFMAAADRLIMSQSTFSWWAAYLGNAVEVHYPLIGVS